MITCIDFCFVILLLSENTVLLICKKLLFLHILNLFNYRVPNLGYTPKSGEIRDIESRMRDWPQKIPNCIGSINMSDFF
jgi:hypothetical protein